MCHLTPLICDTQSGARQLQHLRVRGNALKHYPLSPFTAPMLRHCDLSLNPIESEILEEHDASTDTAGRMDQVRSKLWTMEHDQEEYKRQHQFAEELPCTFQEYEPLRRLDDCFKQLTGSVQVASARGMRLDQIIQIEFGRLSCMLRKLRYLSDWIANATAHLRTHEYLEQKAIADRDDTSAVRLLTSMVAFPLQRLDRGKTCSPGTLSPGRRTANVR